MPARHQRLRERYRPSDVRCLFIAESPPAGGTFFYAADSKLFRHTRAAFTPVYGGAPDGTAFLEFFRSLGCFLEDLSLEPINYFQDRERNTARLAGVDQLTGRLRKFRPCGVVIVGIATSRFVLRSLHNAGLDNVQRYVVPFPTMGHAHRYESELAEAVHQLHLAQCLKDQPPLD